MQKVLTMLTLQEEQPLEYIYGHQNFPLPITLKNPDDQ